MRKSVQEVQLVQEIILNDGKVLDDKIPVEAVLLWMAYGIKSRRYTSVICYWD